MVVAGFSHLSKGEKEPAAGEIDESRYDLDLYSHPPLEGSTTTPHILHLDLTNQWQDSLSAPSLPESLGVTLKHENSAYTEASDAHFTGRPSDKLWASSGPLHASPWTHTSSADVRAQDQSTEARVNNQSHLNSLLWGSNLNVSEQIAISSLDSVDSRISQYKHQDPQLDICHHDSSGRSIQTSPCDYTGKNYSTRVKRKTPAAASVQRGTGPASHHTTWSSLSTDMQGSLSSWNSHQGILMSAQGTGSSSLPSQIANADSSTPHISTSSVNAPTDCAHAAIQQAYPDSLLPDLVGADHPPGYAEAPNEVEESNAKETCSSSRERKNPRKREDSQAVSEPTISLPYSTGTDIATQALDLRGTGTRVGKLNIQRIIVERESSPDSEQKDYPSTQVRHLCPHPQCSKHFSTGGHARRHSRIHFNAARYECPHPSCLATFTRRDNCQQHQRNSHKDVLDAKHVQQQ